MKSIALIMILYPLVSLVQAQQEDIPRIALRDMNGQVVYSEDILEPGAATLIVFWNTYNGKCCENLSIMNEAWTENLKNNGVKMVAICVDCNGSWTQVKPIVDGNGWEFEAYVDINGDFKRALCVGEVPCALLYDSTQQLLCRYNAGCAGSQEYICKNILGHLDNQETALYISPAD